MAIDCLCVGLEEEMQRADHGGGADKAERAPVLISHSAVSRCESLRASALCCHRYARVLHGWPAAARLEQFCGRWVCLMISTIGQCWKSASLSPSPPPPCLLPRMPPMRAGSTDQEVGMPGRGGVETLGTREKRRLTPPPLRCLALCSPCSTCCAHASSSQRYHGRAARYHAILASGPPSLTKLCVWQLLSGACGTAERQAHLSCPHPPHHRTQLDLPEQ